jgi:hypothetical protein
MKFRKTKLAERVDKALAMTEDKGYQGRRK